MSLRISIFTRRPDTWSSTMKSKVGLSLSCTFILYSNPDFVSSRLKDTPLLLCFRHLYRNEPFTFRDPKLLSENPIKLPSTHSVVTTPVISKFSYLSENENVTKTSPLYSLQIPLSFHHYLSVPFV